MRRLVAGALLVLSLAGCGPRGPATEGTPPQVPADEPVTTAPAAEAPPTPTPTAVDPAAVDDLAQLLDEADGIMGDVEQEMADDATS